VLTLAASFIFNMSVGVRDAAGPKARTKVPSAAPPVSRVSTTRAKRREEYREAYRDNPLRRKRPHKKHGAGRPAHDKDGPSTDDEHEKPPPSV
jgi:hypothetical protein